MARKKYIHQGRMIHIRLPEGTHRTLRVRVAEEDTTMQEWVVRVIDRQLKKDAKK